MSCTAKHGALAKYLNGDNLKSQNLLFCCNLRSLGSFGKSVKDCNTFAFGCDGRYTLDRVATIFC